MIDVVPAKPWMADQLRLQSQQIETGQMMTPDNISMAMSQGLALAAVEGDQIFAMAGIYEVWEGRGLAWALLAGDIGPRMAALHRLAARALALTPLVRVEAYVIDDHAEGHRWAALLGFKKEGVMRQFWQGRDFSLYARVR